jgi:hypothetical protein
VRAVAEGLQCGAAAATKRIDAAPRTYFTASLVDQAERAPDEQRTLGRHPNDRDLVPRSHEERFRAVAFPPFRPAAFF